MKSKLSKADKKLAKQFAATLPIYPKRDKFGNFINCTYSISGAEAIAAGQNTIEKTSTIKGPGRSINQFTKMVDIKPTDTLTYQGYLMTDPYKELIKFLEVHGTANIKPFEEDYLKEYKTVQKLLQEQSQNLEKKDDNAEPANIQDGPGDSPADVGVCSEGDAIKSVSIVAGPAKD